MPTLKEIQERLGENYIVRLEYNMKLNEVVITINDKSFTKVSAAKFIENHMNIDEYWNKILLPMKLALDKK